MGPRESFSAPQAHPVWDGIGDRGASCLVGDGERGKRGKGEEKHPDSSQDRGTEMVWNVFGPLAQRTPPPSLVQVKGEREGRRVTGENK